MANGILNQLNQSLALIQQDCLDAAEDLAQPNGHAAIAPATLSLAESTETNDAPQTSDRCSRRA